MRTKIGIFGGTFDPIHMGHLRMALELKQQLALAEMRLLPCHQPAHRGQPQASSEQRVEMLRIALQACPELQIDSRELARATPSYTIDTLRELRAELGAEVSLVLCMGQDAFAGIASWHCWQELLELAHIVVIARPGFALPESGAAQQLLLQHQGDTCDLTQYPAGAIILQAPRLLAISATDIRQQISAGESAQFLMPEGVLDYINAKHLYR